MEGPLTEKQEKILSGTVSERCMKELLYYKESTVI